MAKTGLQQKDDVILKKILFVCTGNTCRSPMAKAIAKDKYEDYSF